MTKLSDTQRAILLRAERNIEELKMSYDGQYRWVRNGRVVENINARSVESLLMRGLLEFHGDCYLITGYGVEALESVKA